MKKIADVVCEHFKQQQHVLMKGEKHDTLKNNVWTHQYVIRRFIKRLVICNQIIQDNDDDGIEREI